MFYTIVQNNSGGLIIRNKDVSDAVCVEANSIEQAKGLLMSITANHRHYCPCCSPRWEFDLDEDDECDVPHIWGEPLDEIDDFNGDVIIHFLDGRKQKINL